MKKILITGGAGFVGRRFTKYFLEKDDSVTCVDCIAPYTGGIDPKKGWPNFAPYDFNNFKFVKTDCRNYFNKNMNKKFDYVLHLAAMVGGRAMIENNPIAVAEDLSIDAAYWSWAKEAKPEKSVYFSSSAAYPIKFQTKNNYKLLSEDMIKFDTEIGMPDMTYGWAKLTGEYLAKLAYEKHGLKSVVYRPFSGYGEDQDMAYPFPSIMERVRKVKNGKIVVWGSGEQKRDFIHIDDCVRGVVSTMDKIDDASPLNLSTGIFTSFKDLIKLASSILGYRPTIVPLLDKPEGVFARGGCTKRQKKFDFTYSITLKDGIKKCV